VCSYVELVHEPATSSIFAMKRMACTDDDELEAAKREISMYQEFNHPNLIVRLAISVYMELNTTLALLYCSNTCCVESHRPRRCAVEDRAWRTRGLRPVPRLSGPNSSCTFVSCAHVLPEGLCWLYHGLLSCYVNPGWPEGLPASFAQWLTCRKARFKI